MTVGALWDNEICPFLGFVLGLWVAGVAIYALLYGWNLSRKLDFLRQKIRAQGPDQWAAYVPPVGMTKVRFKIFFYMIDLSGSITLKKQI